MNLTRLSDHRGWDRSGHNGSGLYAQVIKTLHVLRHAKSDWSDPSLADHDRPLNERGLRGRALVADHVRGWPVDLVVCSTAARAMGTAAPVVEALGCPVRYERSIYDEGTHGLVELIRRFPEDTEVVLLVGHNPGMEKLTSALSGEQIRYPTAALGTIELDVATWGDTGVRCGSLTAHVTPADLAG